MKLNEPGLFTMGASPASAPSDTTPAETIRQLIRFIQQAVEDAAKSDTRLSAGAMAPCWGFAMYFASLLLIAHGDGALHDPEWLLKVEHFKNLLQIFSKRWKIAGEQRREHSP